MDNFDRFGLIIAGLLIIICLFCMVATIRDIPYDPLEDICYKENLNAIANDYVTYFNKDNPDCKCYYNSMKEPELYYDYMNHTGRFEGC